MLLWWMACGAPTSPPIECGACLTVSEVAVPGAVVEVLDDGWVRLDDGSWLRAAEDAGELTLAPGTPPPLDASEWPDLLPDSVPTEVDAGPIRRAWLSGPTDRYAHGALGDDLEASGVSVELEGGSTQTWAVPKPAVLEDQRVRPVDADGDGTLEWWVVRAAPGEGGSPVLLGLEEGELGVVGAGEPIGLGFRWLAPVGVGDLTGDGEIELAWVVRPHLDGTLTLGRWVGDTIEVLDEAPGYSNHRFGATALAMATVADLNDDDIDEVIVPDASYDELHVLDAEGGRWRERGVVPLPDRMVTDLGVVGDRSWVAGLADGRLMWVRRAADGGATTSAP